jgi:hypothetical protein
MMHGTVGEPASSPPRHIDTAGDMSGHLSSGGRIDVFNRPIDHIAYSVEDIDTAVGWWARCFGVGPFFIVDDIEFDKCIHDGKSCVFEHSAAFAAWGDVFVELQRITRAEPEVVSAGLRAGGKNMVNHVAYVVDDPERDSERLEGLGFKQFLYARRGPVAVRFHTAPFLGHAIEIHEANAFLDGFWKMIGDAARDWDGADPLRRIDAP